MDAYKIIPKKGRFVIRRNSDGRYLRNNVEGLKEFKSVAHFRSVEEANGIMDYKGYEHSFNPDMEMRIFLD